MGNADKVPKIRGVDVKYRRGITKINRKSLEKAYITAL